MYWNSEYTWGVFWWAYLKSNYFLHGLLKVGADSQVHSTMQPHETVVAIQWRGAEPNAPDGDTVTAATAGLKVLRDAQTSMSTWVLDAQ